MKPSIQRLISFLISLALIIGAVLIYSTLISPSYVNIKALRSEVKSLEAELQIQEQNVAKLKELLSQFSSLENARQVLALTLPGDPNIPQIVNTVQGLAAINKVLLMDMQADLLPLRSLGGPEYVRNIGIVRSKFSINSDYENFKKFAGQLEKNVRLADIKELNIVANTSDAKELKFNVVADAYYQEPLKVNQPI
ncbi:MAG: type 4a pilus biogenesis protein PilO [Candidatus Liptonbacteria bacterium]|nr:type 4a pilus biogenesis protein PilO [Candidatus Liptonbacteria bacterium]